MAALVTRRLVFLGKKSVSIYPSYSGSKRETVEPGSGNKHVSQKVQCQKRRFWLTSRARLSRKNSGSFTNLTTFLHAELFQQLHSCHVTPKIAHTFEIILKPYWTGHTGLFCPLFIDFLWFNKINPVNNLSSLIWYKLDVQVFINTACRIDNDILQINYDLDHVFLPQPMVLWFLEPLF